MTHTAAALDERLNTADLTNDISSLNCGNLGEMAVTNSSDDDLTTSDAATEGSSCLVPWCVGDCEALDSTGERFHESLERTVAAPASSAQLGVQLWSADDDEDGTKVLLSYDAPNAGFFYQHLALSTLQAHELGTMLARTAKEPSSASAHRRFPLAVQQQLSVQRHDGLTELYMADTASAPIARVVLSSVEALMLGKHLVKASMAG